MMLILWHCEKITKMSNCRKFLVLVAMVTWKIYGAITG